MNIFVENMDNNSPQTSTLKAILRTFERQRALVIAGFIITILGVGASFFFSSKIGEFFLDSRTKSAYDIIHGEFLHSLQKNDISNWQDPEANKRLSLFADEIKNFITTAHAIKIYTPEGITVWTNLKNVMVGHVRPESEAQFNEIKKRKHITLPATESTKEELGVEELLEIWSAVESESGEILGYVEIYFDSSDIASFINKTQFSIWGVLITILIIILSLIYITFRKQDQKLASQSGELTNIIEMSPIGIYTMDRGGVIETYNPAMMRISGIKDARETIGKNVFNAEAYKTTGLAKLLAESTEGAPFETEVEIESSLADHKKTWRHYYGVPIKSMVGDVEHVLVMVQDVTEQKALEKKVREYSADLEKKIAERTTELETKLKELERFQKFTVDRELRMIELKKQIESMRIKLESMGVKIETE